MGGNGALLKETSWAYKGNDYKLVSHIGRDIAVIEKKSGANKLPEESFTAEPIYTSFRKDGSDVQFVAKYDSDHKKLWEIHIKDHLGLNPHFHYWKDGRPLGEQPHALTEEMEEILDKIRKFKI